MDKKDAWDELLGESTLEEGYAYFADLELQNDIADIESGLLSRVDDPDGDIGVKSRRVVKENCAAILSGKPVSTAFLKFMARGMLAYIDDNKSIESTLRLNGKHGLPGFTPDQEADACIAYTTRMHALRKDDDSVEARMKATPFALSDAYAVLYGKDPRWHMNNPDEDGKPSVRAIRERVTRLCQLLHKHGYLWVPEPDDIENIRVMLHVIKGHIFNRK